MMWTRNTFVPAKSHLKGPQLCVLEGIPYLDACFGFACALLLVGIPFSGLLLAAVGVVRSSASQR